MAKAGRPKSDSPKNNRVTIRLKEDQLIRLEKYAEKLKMTKTELLTAALNEFFEKRSDEDKK
ncbi:MAG: ribbon-helix-helix protein, CopG family [Parasporobacterium sp.]|nr:ribbon-helix-helix protein, CopG family [Parasporobacterium sp.]